MATLTRPDAKRLADEAVAALRRGDARTAMDRLRLIVDAAPAILPPWFLVAQAARMLGDDAEEDRALAAHLAGDPRHLPALLMTAALKARNGDDRAAMAFYRTALGVATQPNTAVPAALTPMLRAGEAFLQDAGARFAAHLESGLTDAGLGDGRGGVRLRQALDLLLGRAELYQQQPSMFYFPGLAQRQFFERDEFAWLPAIEAAVPAMREELLAVMAQDAAFTPYVAGAPGRPRPANPLLDDPSWGAFYLWQSGRLVAANARRCPATVTALKGAPIPVIADRSPMALFSLLKPGTHIRPHHGMLNTRLICHMPLLVPPDCAIRVGNETRSWREGEALVFDDSFEHEAWNRSDRTRVVLLFEVWRPELSSEERAALTGIFETIDRYEGTAVDVGARDGGSRVRFALGRTTAPGGSHPRCERRGKIQRGCSCHAFIPDLVRDPRRRASQVRFARGDRGCRNKSGMTNA